MFFDQWHSLFGWKRRQHVVVFPKTQLRFQVTEVVEVSLDGAQIVGFVGFDRSRDKGTPPTTGEIWNIKVIPSHQGKGIGLALWDAAREGLLEEGCSTVTLWLPLSNERALRFHELAGFKREMNSSKTVPKGRVRIEEIRLKRTLA